MNKYINVDIVLVSYNQEDFIEQAVKSVFSQCVSESVKLRVIVADDFSTDCTLEHIRELDRKQYDIRLSSNFTKLQIPFVYLQSSCNLGISKNYQRAFAECRGDYIFILEGDDYWISPLHIENHIQFLESHPECSMSVNNLIIKVENTGEFVAPEWNNVNSYFYIDTRSQISQGNHIGNLSACAIRTDYIHKLPNSLFDMSIADWMLGIMLSQQGLIAKLQCPTSVYRINSNSVWASLSKEQKDKSVIEYSKIYDEYQDGIFHEYWLTFQRNIGKRRHYKIRDFLPPIIYNMLKILVPPICKTIISRFR